MSIIILVSKHAKLNITEPDYLDPYILVTFGMSAFIVVEAETIIFMLRARLY